MRHCSEIQKPLQSYVHTGVQTTSGTHNPVLAQQYVHPTWVKQEETAGAAVSNSLPILYTIHPTATANGARSIACLIDWRFVDNTNDASARADFLTLRLHTTATDEPTIDGVRLAICAAS